ncbi:putative secreted protein (Por secretion system target) [Winogradskyella pacifica]|uniref:Putative secreted protein (Por secretion system target) n=1 Tax=Winogradskyella pacifica TaxID=664642 RepID=A0A3D9LNA4_9FLAO|nr:T9SS type A sorting domain-containing protein [Winogradskyella pacifica]REE08702.1 putative secreted protein (Por secretion system target) [Winogradskyella pacifica]
MNKQLQFIMLLAVISLSNFQLNAQVDGTFTNNAGAGDSLWSTAANWTGGIIADATGTATLEASVDVDADTTVGNLIINTAITISSLSNSTLTLTTPVSSDLIVNNFAGITTVDCNLTLGVSGRFVNIAGATTTFANGNTIDTGTFGLTIKNESAIPVEFHGAITGGGLFNVINGAGSDGGVTFEATSDLSSFIGGFKNRNNPFIFNSTNKISTGTTIELEGTASIAFNVADQFEGDIYKDIQANNTSIVTFNQNQSNLGYLRVFTRPLSLVFADGVNLVQFSSYTTSTTEGVVDLQNYAPGVLKIGTTVSQTILDTWLLNGVEPVDGTLTQDVDGYIIYNTYTTTAGQDINWEDSSTWVGGKIPSLPTDNVVIHGKVNLNSNVEINNITIEHTSGLQEILDIQPGFSLIVNGDAITKDALRASSSSTSSGSLILKGNITGNIRYNKWVNPVTSGNDLVASPVSQTFSTFEASSVNLVENPSTTTQKLFGPFDNTSGEYLNWDTVTNATDDIVLGKGYRAATNTGGTVVFQAQPDSPTTDVTIAITDETTSGAGNYRKWNLIGNPYPSYLDFDTFFDANKDQFDTEAFQAIYGYDGDASDGWTVWNSLNGEKLAPGQGFFVRTKTGGGTVTFTPAMRTIGSSDDFIVGRSANNLNIALAKLHLSNSSDTYSTDIYFVDNQTRGLDPGYDAGAYLGASNGIFTNLVENNTGIDMAIQALPYNDFNDVVVPLGIKGEAGIQLTIGLDTETVSIPSNINIYLEDNVTNTWTILNTGDYVFTPASTLNGTGRFYVHFSSSTLSTEDNLLNGLNIYSEQATKTVVVKGQLNSDTTAAIYDVQGRLIVQNALNTSNTTNTINVNALKAGIYIVELKSNTQNRTQKIIIK